MGAVRLRALACWRIDEDGIGRQLLEGKIDRAPFGTGAVNHGCRNRGRLPRLEPQRPAVGQIDQKASLDHQEQLVRRRLVVPRVVPLEDGQAETMSVHAIDHDVAVIPVGPCTLGDQVDDL